MLFRSQAALLGVLGHLEVGDDGWDELGGERDSLFLQQLTPVKLSQMPYHTATDNRVAGVPTLIARTGYTGEDGFELFFPREKAVMLWDQINKVGAPLGLKPIGLAARDSLRFEARMPLYGQEIGAHLNPLQAGLGWAVSFDKGDFVGRNALLKAKLEGSPNRLVGLEMVERGVPRHGYPVAVNGKVVGEVTTGMFAPTLGKYLALAYVPRAQAALGSEVEVVIRNEGKKARVVKTPFYTPAYRR